MARSGRLGIEAARCRLSGTQTRPRSAKVAICSGIVFTHPTPRDNALSAWPQADEWAHLGSNRGPTLPTRYELSHKVALLQVIQRRDRYDPNRCRPPLPPPDLARTNAICLQVQASATVAWTPHLAVRGRAVRCDDQPHGYSARSVGWQIRSRLG